MTNSDDEGWDDEVAAMKHPDKWRCHNCRGEFYFSQGRVLKSINGRGRGIGYFYCLDCLIALKPEGCHWVAYNDPGRYEYLCFNCPIPELVCDLRYQVPKVVEER